MPESIWLLGFSHYTIAADLILSSVIRSSPKSLWQFSLSLGFYVCNSPCVFVLWLHGLFQAIGNTSDQCVFLSMTEGQEQWQILQIQILQHGEAESVIHLPFFQHRFFIFFFCPTGLEQNEDLWQFKLWGVYLWNGTGVVLMVLAQQEGNGN